MSSLCELTDIDTSYMKTAISCGNKARVAAPPNPWVGCVLVKNNQTIGEGYSAHAGGPHAETEALKMAGERTKGATCYVTLEPCSHHGQTPPCCDTLIAAGLKRVVIGIKDPDPRVAGSGIERLRQSGIEVHVGCLKEDVETSLRPYLFQRKNRRPFCIAKIASSLDGRTAAADASSQWISTPEAQVDAHRLRAESQAILIGAGTACHDLPTLSIRHGVEKPPSPPIRIILDPNGRVPIQGPLADTSHAPTMVVTTDNPTERWQKSWLDLGAEVLRVPVNDQQMDLKLLFQRLVQRGVLQLMIEGGATTLTRLWKQKLIDAIRLYIGPRLIGVEGHPLFDLSFGPTLSMCPILTLEHTEMLGQTVRLDYLCKRPF